MSCSRSEIDEKIIQLYRNDIHRKQEIERCFNEWLDKREWTILREDLPSIKVFSTELLEPTIELGRKHLEIENILVIEGKPGVGKSHFVNCLIKEFTNSIVYRFWIGSQDKDYEKRLKYKNFIFDFSKKLFNDLKPRNQIEIFDKIKEEQKTVIIDGLDHIENYNNSELEKYIEFINQLKEYCKVIVLSRPLQKKINWQKQLLSNWNKEQTQKVLNELFHISDYSIYNEIFSITDGYPILVKYIAEYYKKHKSIPKLEKLESVDSYYNKIIKQEKGKHALSLFLCSRSFFMESEIEMILEEESAIFVKEFIEEHPYLFEIRLNRITLFHDSFNTYLRKQEINYSNILSKVNGLVYNSIDNLNKRFLSRFSFFNIEPQIKRDIIRKYSSIEIFKELISDAVDFEAIQSFYIQIREALCELPPEELDIKHYYDLSLILNIVNRDHISSLNGFYYTYAKTLLNNGYSEEDITSSKYLFAMLCFVQSNDATLLFNATSDDLYSTELFYENLHEEIDEENFFFNRHDNPLTKEEINELLQDKFKLKDNLTYILENLFIHNNPANSFNELHSCIKKYMAGQENAAISLLTSFLYPYNTQSYYPSWTLKDAKRNILAYGYLPNTNDYKTLSLLDFIYKNKDLGSFDLRDETHNFIRLSLYESRTIDISSIALFWTKYYQRKDYSLISLDSALKVLEAKDYVPKFECCKLINKIQEVSEKGYRGLLSGYIELYSPQMIIPFISNNFEIKDLRIEWFLLPTEYIDIFPDKVFNTALNNILKYNYHNKEIDLNEIQNVLYSNRLEELESILDLTKYSIRVSKSHPIIKEFKNSRFRFKEFSPDDKNDFKEDSQSHFNQGVLTIKDKEFILMNNLKSYELAGFSNGYNSALADTVVYKIFKKEDIKQNFKTILYNALLGKTRSINFFYNVYYFPGNVLKMIYDYEIDADFDSLFKSFLSYLELSMFNLNLTKSK